MERPIDKEIVAAFMMEGLHDAGYDKVLDAWGNGCLELISEMVQYADYCWRLAEAGAGISQEFPGVFDYEVSSAFGSWFGSYVLANHSTTPSKAQCCAVLRAQAYAFFNNLPPQENPQLRAALASVEEPS